jgi:hypothetical protein
MGYKLRDQVGAFWNKVEKRGPMDCWPWKGGISGNGYGNFRNIRSHKYAWELKYNKVPDGLYVCHHCDNKLCCNTNHMFLGTPLDNMLDKVRKRRGGIPR